MTKWRGLTLALIAFTFAYSAAYEATNWISVYLLDWWDPKFGGRRGNIDFGHMLMLPFVVVALVSFLFALVFHWPWLRTAPSKPVMWASAGGALLANSAVFLFNLALREVDGGSALAVINWILLLGGPAIFSGCMFALAPDRRKSAAAGDA